MSLRKIAGLLVAFGLVVGLIGGGVGATFTNTLSASQTITVGVMDVQFGPASTGTISNGGRTLTCPAIHIVTASGMDTSCSFVLVSKGDIAASQVNVSMAAATSGADLTKFGIAPTGLTSGSLFYWLKTTDQPIGYVFGSGLPATVAVPVSWGEYAGVALDNGDMGQSVTISYTIVANGG